MGYEPLKMIHSLRMIKRGGVFCLCLSVTACTTVDLSQQTTSSTVADHAKPQSESPVVLSANTLVTAFENAGWTKTSLRQKKQSVASVLLKGVSWPQPNTNQGSGLGLDTGTDLNEASKYVTALNSAAISYINYVSAIEDVSIDLASLEAAIYSVKQAEHRFAHDIQNTDTQAFKQKFETYQNAVDQLSRVADIYGERTRAFVTAQNASNAGS